MTITDVALSSIAREALRSIDGLETGGILLGDDVTDEIGIRHAGGPGPNATRGERTLVRDLDHARRLADSAWLEDRGQCIGEWHTHPTGSLSPSQVDLHSYMRHLHDPELGSDRFVAIIAGFDSWARAVAGSLARRTGPNLASDTREAAYRVFWKQPVPQGRGEARRLPS